MLWVKRICTNYLKKKGRYLGRYPLAQYLSDLRIDCVLDVGANVGQYGKELRSIGYSGRIESFEPLSAAHDKLSVISGKDNSWNAHQFALGAKNADLKINIGKSTATSSILPISSELDSGFNNLDYVGVESIVVKPLDEIFGEISNGANQVFMKIDAQGYEGEILAGATSVLSQIKGMQIEVSLSRVYEGEELVEDIVGHLRKHGLIPYWIINGFRNENTMQLFQADIIFIRE